MLKVNGREWTGKETALKMFNEGSVWPWLMGPEFADKMFVPCVKCGCSNIDTIEGDDITVRCEECAYRWKYKEGEASPVSA